MRPILAAAPLLLVAGCATLPMMPWEETALRSKLRAEGFTKAIQIEDQGHEVQVLAAGPAQTTNRTYARPGMRLRKEYTDRGDNSFMRQEIDAQGELLSIEFWVGNE